MRTQKQTNLGTPNQKRVVCVQSAHAQMPRVGGCKSSPVSPKRQDIVLPFVTHDFLVFTVEPILRANSVQLIK